MTYLEIGQAIAIALSSGVFGYGAKKKSTTTEIVYKYKQDPHCKNACCKKIGFGNGEAVKASSYCVDGLCVACCQKYHSLKCSEIVLGVNP